MQKFKKYNPEAECKKCGSADINDVWHEKDHFQFPHKYYGMTEEIIERHCRNCQFEWFERPLELER